MLKPLSIYPYPAGRGSERRSLFRT
jgi:hypothetical protein